MRTTPANHVIGATIRERILRIAAALPAAPRIFAALTKLLSNANSPVESIAKLIKLDPALSANVIRVSNSAYHRGEVPTGAIEEAVARVGYREVYRLLGFVAGVRLAEKGLPSYGLEAARLRDHMLRTAFLCEQLALESDMDARTAYTAGLMRLLGLFVCDRLPEPGGGSAVQPYDPASGESYLQWEQRTLGVTNPAVAALVLEEWRFPEEIVEAVREHLQAAETGRNAGDLACLLHLAGAILDHEGEALPGECGQWQISERLLAQVGLTPEQVENAAANARVQHADYLGRVQEEDTLVLAKPVASARSISQVIAKEKKSERSPPAAAEAAAEEVAKGAAGEKSSEKCDLEAASGVVGKNDDHPVHTTPAETAVTTPTDFTTFMRNYQDMVYTTAARLTGNETQAEDIAQEVFIKAHTHWDSLRGSPTAGGWLKTVATNLSLNHIQRYKKRWSFFSDLVHRSDEGEEKEVEFAAPDTFFAGVDSSERREWIERALEKLPAHQRVPLVLFHFEEMPYEEIAKKLGVSLSKVKTDILRAREALAKILVRSGASHEKFSL